MEKLLRDAFPDVFVTEPSSQAYILWDEAIDDHFNLNTYYNGDYNLAYFMKEDLFRPYADFAWNTYVDSNWVIPKNADSYRKDQHGYEFYNAGYIMTELNLFRNKVQLIPGIRYEKMEYKYNALSVVSPLGNTFDRIGFPDGYIDTVTYDPIVHEHFFPSLHVKVKPVDWADLRLSYFKSIARSDFSDITPFSAFDEGKDPDELRLGNQYLKPAIAHNFDIYLSFYQNNFGLFTVGYFYKEISNLTRSLQTQIIDSTESITYTGSPDYISARVYKPLNSDHLATVQGLEFDFQTNFRYLPKPFGGILFSANLTLIESETGYDVARSYPERYRDENGRLRTRKVRNDTVYYGPMVNQSKMVLNLNFGYEYKGFQANISYLFQSGTRLSHNPQQPFMSEFGFDYSRWDLKVKQKLPVNGLEAYLTIDNITNSRDGKYRNTTYRNGYYVEQEEYYGMNVNLGLKYKF